MARASHHGSTPPPMFEEMDPGDTQAWLAHVDRLVDAEREFQLEAVKAIVRSNEQLIKALAGRTI